MKSLRHRFSNYSVVKRYKFKLILWIAIFWTIIDSIFFMYWIAEQIAHSQYSLFPKTTFQAVLLREVNVFFLSLLMAWLLVFILKDRFRKLSQWGSIFLKTIILLLVALGMNLFIQISYLTLISGSSFSFAIESSYKNIFEVNWILQKTPEWIILFILTQMMIEIYEKYSPRTFFDILLRKYVQPKDERRIIMFIDLNDSTTIAEKLGHKQYFKFIRDFIYYISTGIIGYEGRIYQYVGDEIVVSWPDSKRNARKALLALIEARKFLHKNLDGFQLQFGILPDFKGGIHVGEVTIGEIGAIKKELVMSGETMNTAARLNSACNEFNQKFIVSKDFLDYIDLKTWQTEPLGTIDLAVKNSSIELFALKI